MNYTIDRTLEICNVIDIKSENVEYKIVLVETAPGSKLWTITLALVSGTPNKKDIYNTIGTVSKILLEKGGLIEKNNVTEIIMTIDGKDREEIDKKTKVFTRWIKSPWTFEITSNPVISIQGMSESIYLNTNLIHIKKSSIIENKEGFKFCFNCGHENKESYKFCPSCGTNLEQR